MHGTVTVLCVNENYEKFNDLLQANQPLMVIGEVNNSEDTPKIFPQEIMPLEDAPRKFTKQVHLRLRMEKISDDSLESVRALTQAHPGKIPLLLCLRQPGGAAVFVEANERFNVTPSADLQQEADTLFGDDTYYVKVDTEVPEPQRRRRYAKNGHG
jgi:DNA polymerase III alpha subunit